MITKNERNLLEFVPIFQKEQRHNPSVQDISQALGKSDCWVRYTLRKFKSKKIVSYTGNIQHSLKVLKTPAEMFDIDN